MHTDLSLMQGEKDGLLSPASSTFFSIFYNFYTGHLLPLHLSPSVFRDLCIYVHDMCCCRLNLFHADDSALSNNIKKNCIQMLYNES